ncbi:hypothetical protein [Methylocapsa palsarum]|uniref:Uncharacterized protein n=1 Tax=Methylocapsa palsarum TaxID=1612308 RepID=A0A1I3W8N4_9HYPH|nr:hypothetical protein [Methylocapsa palsarum]SFK03845.1 hypothetical protein SAMN05444581_101429 [Methylocapsa palsarum]
MAKAFEWTRQSLYIGLIGFLLCILWVDFRSICNATQEVLGRAGSMTSLEIASVKINFDRESVSAAFTELNKGADLADGDIPGFGDDDKRRVLKVIDVLDQRQFVRLMYVGQLEGLCEFKTPANSQMRYDVATDYRLVEMKLAEMVDDPKTFEDVTRRVKAGGRGNGDPIRCYMMRLTTDGYNVKTALVGNFSAAFKGTAKSAPSDTRVAAR